MTNKQDVLKKENNLPAENYDVQITGFEGQTQEDWAIPYLKLLQDMSPEVKKNEVEDAQSGDLYDSSTEMLYKGNEGVLFVPCMTQHFFNEWVPRKKGGGMVGQYKPNHSTVVQAKQDCPFGELTTPAGNDLVETFIVFGILTDEEQEMMNPMTIYFKSTFIKVYRKWMAKAKMIQVLGKDGLRHPAPLFSHVYRITSQSQTNNGDESFNFKVSFNGKNASECRLSSDSPLYQAAYDLALSVQKGDKGAQQESDSSVMSEDDVADCME